MLNNETTIEKYTYEEILNIDEMEKRKIPLYASFNFREGIYTSWKTFCKQIPDKPLVVETSDEAYKVKTPDTDGKLQKVNPKDIYAIVYRGRP